MSPTRAAPTASPPLAVALLLSSFSVPLSLGLHCSVARVGCRCLSLARCALANVCLLDDYHNLPAAWRYGFQLITAAVVLAFSPLVPSRMPAPPLPATSMLAPSCRVWPRGCPVLVRPGNALLLWRTHTLFQASFDRLAVTTHWSWPQDPGCTEFNG